LELRGEYVYKISTEKKSKYLTISKTKTFMPASRDRDFVKGQLMRNLESACIKLRRHELSARALTVYLRKSDFSGSGIKGYINRHSSSTLDFTGVCARLFEQIFEGNYVYRATGVVFSDIIPQGRDEGDLFADPVRIERIEKISAVIDSINKAYGKHAVHLASCQIISEKGAHPRNCQTWRKQELLKGETFRRRIGIPLLKLK
jgi:DNA polymerase IV